jgi:excisionase family DNA binding protein
MITEQEKTQIAARTCVRCGQEIQPTRDSWEMHSSGGIQHVTCPASEEMKELPSLIPQSLPAQPHPAPSPVFLTMDEAAKLLRVSKDTIRIRIRQGVLPAQRLRGGQTVLIARADVLGLLEPIPAGEE